MKKTHIILLSFLISLFIACVSIQPQNNNLKTEFLANPTNIHPTNIKIVYDTKQFPSSKLLKPSLCSESKKSMNIAEKKIDKTIGEIFDSDITTIKVNYFDAQYNHNSLEPLILNILKSKPDTIFNHQPWAEGVTIGVIATMVFSDGKETDLEIGTSGKHVCFKDKNNSYWWFRLNEH